MNIKKLNEEIEDILSDDDFNKAYDQVKLENEEAERKAILRVFQKAYGSLEELQTWFEDNMVNPSSGKMDKETEEFYNKLQDVVNEIYSRSLAYEE